MCEEEIRSNRKGASARNKLMNWTEEKEKRKEKETYRRIGTDVDLLRSNPVG